MVFFFPAEESYEDTEENFHLAIDAILNHEEERDMAGGPKSQRARHLLGFRARETWSFG